MRSIFIKEINIFLSSLVGYIAVAVFLITTGLFFWVFPETSVLQQNLASLEGFFFIAPWILLFLIPSITMRLLAEEKNAGTIELLVTKPLSDMQIILGKFFAAWFLLFLALVPTVIYYFSLVQLGSEVGNIDKGATLGSYLGLLFMSGCFVAIGLLASAITKNQIVAFVIGIFFCFIAWSGFESISALKIFSGNWDYIIEQFSIRYHYRSISLGILDLRDFLFFASFIVGCLFITKTIMESRKWA